MEKIIWKEGFSVNVQELDKEHKKLIDMINKLIDVANAPGVSEVILETLNEMTKYAQDHFIKEEGYMLKYGYPDYRSHKKEHDEFKLKTAEFCEDAAKDKTTIPTEIITYLRDWFVRHILNLDMKCGPFFNKQGIE